MSEGGTGVAKPAEREQRNKSGVRGVTRTVGMIRPSVRPSVCYSEMCCTCFSFQRLTGKCPVCHVFQLLLRFYAFFWPLFSVGGGMGLTGSCSLSEGDAEGLAGFRFLAGLGFESCLECFAVDWCPVLGVSPPPPTLHPLLPG
ncbi:hypothetical protein Z043_118450 [Scleropages formosus]|uniref:Uncharacterized protein n=1 Tax=Scleropages formosus TaxID=113540 RepID=A0A0P7TPZ1_SCLFO|nr:hypothetical protein Z043_118450 [Scleropages formosus]